MVAASGDSIPGAWFFAEWGRKQDFQKENNRP